MSLGRDSDLSRSLAEVIPERYPWLYEELGLKKTYADYSYRSFGNSTLILASDKIRVRFDRDRGITTDQLGAPADLDRWWSPLLVYEVIYGHPPKYPESEIGLDWYANFLRSNFDAFAEALGSNYVQTKQELEQRQEAGIARLKQEFAQRTANREPERRPWWRIFFD